MPSAEAIARSSGVVTKPRTSSAAAPTYTVVTVICAFSLRGYWRTFSDRIAWIPAIRMRRFTTSATTGRLMNRSVNFMRSPVHRLRRHLGGGSQVVPHHHGHAVAELEGATAHHRLARLEPGDHRHQVAASLAEADELLVGEEPRVPGLVLLLLDGEHRVPVGGVEDRGARDHQHRPLLGGEDFDVPEHAGAQASVLVGEYGAHAHVAGGDVDLRVEGGEHARPRDMREDVGQ